MTHRFETLIIGAGPAGVTAALELARAGHPRVLVVEATDHIGGLSKTINYKGNRIDIGGHRFFSKSDWVMDWWRELMPVAAPSSAPTEIAYHQRRRIVVGDNARPDAERVMLLRKRLSRIYFDRKFFDYPLKASLDTAIRLGPLRCAVFFASYLRARLFQRKPEKSLEDFFINRFGVSLYQTFFKEYTEKVWGVACSQISAEWGAQRVKSLSVGNALWNALGAPFRRGRSATTATSLIETFLYPKLGPGQMWETACAEAMSLGITVMNNARVVSLKQAAGRIVSVTVQDEVTGVSQDLEADHFISTMPVRDLIANLIPQPPPTVQDVAAGLHYRDFITVGLLYQRLLRDEGKRPDGGACTLPDNWIYIQEPGVNVGRLQFFNNWSPFMVSDPNRVWVGMEFFCQEGDALWTLNDPALIELGVREMEKIGLAAMRDCEDGMVIRTPKAYPGYYGTYARFNEVREYLDGIANLYLVGRNGMHRYNNQDHSMLTARLAVEAILAGNCDKSAIWAVNIDDDYHEEVAK